MFWQHDASRQVDVSGDRLWEVYARKINLCWKCRNDRAVASFFARIHSKNGKNVRPTFEVHESVMRSTITLQFSNDSIIWRQDVWRVCYKSMMILLKSHMLQIIRLPTTRMFEYAYMSHNRFMLIAVFSNAESHHVYFTDSASSIAFFATRAMIVNTTPQTTSPASIATCSSPRF